MPVNIAEGAARKSNKEFIQFLHIALGSLTELDTLLLLGFELSFISQEQLNTLIEKLDVIGKLVYGLIKSIEKKISNSLHFTSHHLLKNSDIGPKANAGKKLSAAIIAITAKTMMPNVVVSVFNVPALSGTYFFFARIPAMATGPMMGRKRPINITMPQVIFQNGTPSPKPSKPLPLLADEEVYSYNISPKP